jgi:hypothetical protein
MPKKPKKRRDTLNPSVVSAMNAILEKGPIVSPVAVLMEMGRLSANDCENWRFGRVPFLEQVITGNLSICERIIKIIRFEAGMKSLTPSFTVYHKYGNGKKIRLRFSKTGNPFIEILYSTHYVSHHLLAKARQQVSSEDTPGDQI